MTANAIGLIFYFIIEHLNKKSELRLIEFRSGMSKSAETLLVKLNKKVDYVGFEVEDLLLDLSALMAEIKGSQFELMQIDEVQ